MTQQTNIGRRNALTALAAAASTTAMDAALSTPAAAQTTSPPESNPYNSPPGSGISMPPYYRPTPSIKNNNNYFPQTEQLGDAEMRITFMGSNPFPPRLSQAGTCIMVECGNVGRFFFDFGSGCLRNIVGNQVPVAEVNDIFLSHLHVDHYADLQYLGPSLPLRCVSSHCA
jgi:ribonuclease Z